VLASTNGNNPINLSGRAQVSITAAAEDVGGLPLTGGTLTGDVTIDEAVLCLNSGFDWSAWEYTSYIELRIDWNHTRILPSGVQVINPSTDDPVMALVWNDVNFGIERWDDGGNYLGHAFTVWRDTGNVSIANDIAIGTTIPSLLAKIAQLEARIAALESP
jgi:hypothetical protein